MAPTRWPRGGPHTAATTASHVTARSWPPSGVRSWSATSGSFRCCPWAFAATGAAIGAGATLRFVQTPGAKSSSSGGLLVSLAALWVTVGMAAEAFRGELRFPIASGLIGLMWWSIAAILVLSGRRSLRTPERDEALAELEPASRDRCELCQAALAPAPRDQGGLIALAAARSGVDLGGRRKSALRASDAAGKRSTKAVFAAGRSASRRSG